MCRRELYDCRLLNADFKSAGCSAEPTDFVALCSRRSLMAYASTIIANTVRICIALEMQRDSFHLQLFDHNELHRLEGIVVYFAFLLLLFLLTEPTETQSLKTRLKRLSFPLAIYYGTTLLLPLLNLQHSKSLVFWEHSLFVLLVPILVSLLAMSGFLVSDLTKAKLIQ